MTDARTSRVSIETLVLINPDRRVSRIYTEVLWSPDQYITDGVRATSTETVRAGTIVVSQSVAGARVAETDTVRAGVIVQDFTGSARVSSAESVRVGVILQEFVGSRATSFEEVRIGSIEQSIIVEGGRIESVEVVRAGEIEQQESLRVHLEIRRDDDTIQRVRLGRRNGDEIQWLTGEI